MYVLSFLADRDAGLPALIFIVFIEGYSASAQIVLAVPITPAPIIPSTSGAVLM